VVLLPSPADEARWVDARPAGVAPMSTENFAPLPAESTPDAADALGLTQVPRDSSEARLRALFALFFHEAGLEPIDATVSALAAAARRLGYVIVPVRR
jgi:hypothetical protein